MLDLTAFVPRLKQVIVWTSYLMNGLNFSENSQNYGSIFRRINPIINGQTLYNSDQGYITWNLDDYVIENYRHALQLALEQRDECKSTINFELDELSEMGRILCHSIGYTTHDGIAIVESNCFVDESDVPPIDTWFFLLEKINRPYNTIHSPTLFCWIPKEFESVMQQAINVEVIPSSAWLDEEEPHFYHQLLIALAG